jgi:acetyl esterase/lipase
MVWCARDYIGGPEQEAPLASPLAFLESLEMPFRLPSFLLAVGDRDPLLDDSVRLDRVLKARGASSTLLVYPGEGHGFDAFLKRPAARAKWRATFAFLKEHLRAS